MSFTGMIPPLDIGLCRAQNASRNTPWEMLQEKTKQQPAVSYLTRGEAFHRFSNIRCAKETAIFVNIWNGYAFEKCYLHANAMGKDVAKRRFIAAEYPGSLPKPCSKAEDWIEYLKFWNAAFQNQATIVDLTTQEEARSFGPYYPSKENGLIWDVYRTIVVVCQSENEGVCEYQVQFTNPDSPPVKIQRYHFSKWPDFGVISAQELHALVERVENLHTDLNTPLWVHCSAGVGRTGVLIAAMIIKEQFKKGILNQENLEEKIVDLIAQLRSERDDSLIATEKQLDLLISYAKLL